MMTENAMKAAIQQRIAQGAVIGGGALNQAIKPPADFATLLARMQSAVMEVRETAAHAANIADTIHGHPSCGGCAEERVPRSGLIGQYEDAMDDLVAEITEARSHLRRISNGIPSPQTTLR